MNNQELKHRISAVNDTVKITRAMQMIAVSKMHRARKKSDESYRYLDEITKMLSLIGKDINHPYLKNNKSTEKAVMVVAGDKGLCGDYNLRVFKEADKFIEENNVKTVFAIGHESREHFRRSSRRINNAYTHMQEPHSFDAEAVVYDVLSMFSAGAFSELYIVYTKTPTPQSQLPHIKKLLPITLPENAVGEDDSGIIIEPCNDEAVSSFLEQYIMAEIYSALADSELAINYKRMTSMKESTSNGEALIEQLTMEFNHRRQETITNELMDSSSAAAGGDNR